MKSVVSEMIGFWFKNGQPFMILLLSNLMLFYTDLDKNTMNIVKKFPEHGTVILEIIGEGTRPLWTPPRVMPLLRLGIFPGTCVVIMNIL